MKLFSSILFFTIITFLNLQASINTDRPGRGDSPYNLKKSVFQSEFGFNNSKVDELQSNTVDALLRYGVNDNFEVRMILGYTLSKEQNNDDDGYSDTIPRLPEAVIIDEESGVIPPQIGLKANLMKNDGWVPQSSLTMHIGLPIPKSRGLEAAQIPLSFLLNFSNTLSDNFSLSYSAGAFYDNSNPFISVVYSLSLGYSIAENFSVFGEFYSEVPHRRTAGFYADAGMQFLITDNMQLDAWFVKGLNEYSTDLLLSVGLSYMVD